ncbi:MAG: hypothetical protein MK212_17620 [Saprospiraceae bacterium]|nr:hypothetical protein [Saprospiraceae bacterium]
MEYTFRKNFAIVNHLELCSNSEVLNAFFHAFSKKQYLNLLQGLVKQEGYLGDPKGLIFYHELDGEDFAEGHVFAEHEVELYFNGIGTVQLDQQFFFSIAIAYGQELNKIHAGDIAFCKALQTLLDILNTWIHNGEDK